VRFTPHDFRRLFTTELVGAGLPLHIAASLLGHLSLDTTRGYTAALTELTDLFRPGADAPPSLPRLADYVAARLHVDIILAELPLLAAAIRADHVAGADPRSRGEIFLEVNKDLLEELDRGVPDEQRLPVGIRALEAFDAAGIGRESLEQESTSDQLIRTTATAAAMTCGVPEVRLSL
jgi:hypothetical protein